MAGTAPNQAGQIFNPYRMAQPASKESKPGTTRQLSPEDQEAKKTMVRSVVGVGVGGLIALICCSAWVIVGVLTQSEWGFMAWAIGGLIGWTCGAIARNPSPIYCIFPSALTALTFLAAKAVLAIILMTAVVVLSYLGSSMRFGDHYDMVTMSAAEKMMEEGVFHGYKLDVVKRETNSFFSNFPYTGFPILELEGENHAYFDIGQEIDKRISELPSEDVHRFIEQSRQRHGEWIEYSYQYDAIIDEMLVNNEFMDPVQIAVAKAEIAHLDPNSENFITGLVDQGLANDALFRVKKIVSEKRKGLSSDQLDEMVIRTIGRHPTWNAIPDATSAILEKLYREGKIPDDLVNFVQMELYESDILDNEPTNDLGWITDDAHQQIQKLANAELVKLNRIERQAQIKNLADRIPDWHATSLMDFDRNNLADDVQDELGNDGTFWTAFVHMFSLFDILWFALGISTAFGVAYQQGNADD